MSAGATVIVRATFIINHRATLVLYAKVPTIPRLNQADWCCRRVRGCGIEHRPQWSALTVTYSPNEETGAAT